jgi:hypothetical protein
LHLAATRDCEKDLGQVVIDLIKNDLPLSLVDLQNKYNKKPESHPAI